MKLLWIWIYEYKDDDTPIGATFFEGFVEDISDTLQLSRLQEPWHWRIETSYKEEHGDNK